MSGIQWLSCLCSTKLNWLIVTGTHQTNHVLSASLSYWDPALDFSPYLMKSSDSKLFKISEQLSAADSMYTEGVCKNTG